MATPGEWDSILAAIHRLDIPQLQVQLEVKILEVTLTGDLQFGVQWYLSGLIGTRHGFGSRRTATIGQTFTGNSHRPPSRDRLAPPATSGPTNNGGFFYSFLNKNFEVAINALQTERPGAHVVGAVDGRA